MQQDNYVTIVKNSLNSINYKNDVNYKDVVLAFKKTIDENKDLILTTNNIDITNETGKKINFKVIDNIFERVLLEDLVYGTVTLSKHDKNRKIIYGRQIYNKGNILVVFDGDFYVLLELIIRNILANNSVIFNYPSYNFALNTLFITFIQSVLEKSNFNPLQIQQYVSSSLEILNCTNSFSLVISCCEEERQKEVLINSHYPVLLLDYTNYNIYVEDSDNVSFVNEIISLGINFTLYVKEHVGIEADMAIYVSDCEEAIGQINMSKSSYGAAIFTKDMNNASMFIKKVNSKIVTVNTSPTIERVLDIKQSDLYNEKTIVYPGDFNIIDEKSIKVD